MDGAGGADDDEDAVGAAEAARCERLAQLHGAAEGGADALERLAQLEGKLSQLRGLSSFLTSLPQQGEREVQGSAAPEPEEVAEHDPRVLMAEWQSFDARMSDRLHDAFERRREIDRSVEELESQLRYSDEATTRLQAEMMTMADEVEGWAASAAGREAHNGGERADTAAADERIQTLATPPAEDVLSELVMPRMDASGLSALACTCYALATRADEIFEQRVRRMLATDKFGAPVSSTLSAPASVCAAFTSGAFPAARIGEDEDEEVEQAEIRVQLQRGWRRMFRVLYLAWMPDDSGGYASTRAPIVAGLLPSAPELEGLVAAVLAAQVDAGTDVLEKMDAVEDYCAARATAAQADAHKGNGIAAMAWLSVLLRYQTLRFRWVASTAGRGAANTVAARLMRAVTTGRLAMLVRSTALQEAVGSGENGVPATNTPNVETAMVSELLGRLAERELFQCLGLAWAAREDAINEQVHGNGSVAAQAMVGVGLRELGSLYHHWAAWADCENGDDDDDDDDGDNDDTDEVADVKQDVEQDDEQSEPEPQPGRSVRRQRRIRVGSAAACEEAVCSIASRLDDMSSQVSNPVHSGEAQAVPDAAPSKSVTDLIAAEPTLHSRWVRSEEGWSAPRVEALKQRGNAAFRQKQFDTALQFYRDALELCDQTMVGGTTHSSANATTKELETPSGLSPLDELERDCLLNCAAAALQLKEASSAAACCDAAIAIDPSHPKAFFRRAQAYTALRKRKRALSDYQTASTLAPRNATIIKAYKAAKQEALDRRERQKAKHQRSREPADIAAGGAEQ